MFSKVSWAEMGPTTSRSQHGEPIIGSVGTEGSQRQGRERGQVYGGRVRCRETKRGSAIASRAHLQASCCFFLRFCFISRRQTRVGAAGTHGVGPESSSSSSRCCEAPSSEFRSAKELAWTASRATYGRDIWLGTPWNRPESLHRSPQIVT